MGLFFASYRWTSSRYKVHVGKNQVSFKMLFDAVVIPLVTLPVIASTVYIKFDSKRPVLTHESGMSNQTISQDFFAASIISFGAG